jgi:hypothetical protein
VVRELQEIVFAEAAVEFPREVRGVFHPNSEGDQGTDVAQDRMAHVRRKLVEVLVGDRKPNPVLAKLGEHVGYGEGGEALELVDVDEEVPSPFGRNIGYNQSRARTYACCFSLENTDYIWRTYATGGALGKICVVFDFAKLRARLNHTLTQSNSALEYNGIRCHQIFSINYGVVEYELNAVEDRRDAERTELNTATQELLEERSKFHNFQCRVADLVQQIVLQTTEDRRAQEDLESRLADKSREFKEREFEIEQLRSEIKIAHKSEADLRVAIDELNTAIQNLEAEMEKLRAALDRANGERMRLSYELANMKSQGNCAA